MKIDRKTNLVVELPREDEPSVFAHSTPLAAEVLEQYHSLAGPTMNALVTRGYGYFAPRYAASVLREIATEQAELSAGPDRRNQEAAKDRAKVRVDGFFAEIRRKTHILALDEDGWGMLPLADAMKADAIDDEELVQIENALVFFTFGLRSWVKAQRQEVSGGLSLCNARIVSLSCTDFMSSLRTLTKDDNSGANPDASPGSSPGQQAPGSRSTSADMTSHGPALPHIAIVS